MAKIDNNNNSLLSDGVKRKDDTIGRATLATFIAALGSLSFGYCLGYSSSALEDLENTDASSAVHLSSNQGSWFSVS